MLWLHNGRGIKWLPPGCDEALITGFALYGTAQVTPRNVASTVATGANDQKPLRIAERLPEHVGWHVGNLDVLWLDRREQLGS